MNNDIIKTDNDFTVVYPDSDKKNKKSLSNSTILDTYYPDHDYFPAIKQIMKEEDHKMLDKFNKLVGRK